jgi:hypothetical protein
VTPGPGDPLGLPQLEEEAELLDEELIVVREVSVKDPRPAMISARPFDRTSSVAKS